MFALGAFSVVTDLYADNLTAANGKLKAAFGIGMLIGYLFGSLLYLGGYFLVCTFYAILVTLSAILPYKWIPLSLDGKRGEIIDDPKDNSSSKYTKKVDDKTMEEEDNDGEDE